MLKNTLKKITVASLLSVTIFGMGAGVANADSNSQLGKDNPTQIAVG
jgi:hypothetical protein